MWCAAVTLFPSMFQALHEGITGRAIRAGLFELAVVDPRDFADNKHKTVDDRPYGGGPGMVMMAAPLRAAIHEARRLAPSAARVIGLTPSGRPFTGAMARAYAKERQPLIFVAGRYEGIDQRVVESDLDEQISVGDYVLSGGELAAMVVMDAVIRWLPGALGHDGSAIQDAFSLEYDGLLDCPHYTRPACLGEQTVPSVLLSGDHEAIARWRRKQSLGQTWRYRPDLLTNRVLDSTSQALLAEFIDEEQR